MTIILASHLGQSTWVFLEKPAKLTHGLGAPLLYHARKNNIVTDNAILRFLHLLRPMVKNRTIGGHHTPQLGCHHTLQAQFFIHFRHNQSVHGHYRIMRFHHVKN